MESWPRPGNEASYNTRKQSVFMFVSATFFKMFMNKQKTSVNTMHAVSGELLSGLVHIVCSELPTALFGYTEQPRTHAPHVHVSMNTI